MDRSDEILQNEKLCLYDDLLSWLQGIRCFHYRTENFIESQVDKVEVQNRNLDQDGGKFLQRSAEIVLKESNC